MSWDKTYKKEICPCGKGALVQEVRDDDWNRVEFGKPYIECEECKTKYKIIERHFFQPPWKGDGVCYYLVPVDLVDETVYENKYTNIDEQKLAQEDFSKCLKCVYSLNVLREALSELKKISNCASAKGFAREIIKLRRRYLHSCRLKELTQEIIKAINTYDEGPNFELISAEEERNSKKRAAFWEKVKAVGREIF